MLLHGGGRCTAVAGGRTVNNQTMTSGQSKIDACDVDVIIAAHNEAAAIGDVVSGVRRALPGAVVIVVDDGSIDPTSAEALRAGAQVIHLWPNRGKGVALREGIAASRGRWLVLIDGDGQDDPADAPKLLAAARDGVALVNGSRFMGRLHRGAISVPNYFGNLLMTATLDACFGARVTDSQAGFRVLDGPMARSLPLRSREYEIETEVLAKLLRRGGVIVEVPIDRYPRSGGTTDFRRVRNGLRILATIIRERLVGGA
jgi:glycosyltransferase involved in cell wall biosynthesis